MAEPLSETALSPLDQIRLAEAEITRKTVAVREESERRLIEARVQAKKIKKQAREIGTLEGKILYKEIIAHAEEEAHAITAHAQNQAGDLHQKGHSRMELAVEYAVGIVLGLNKYGREDEP